jgi:hypothetical protein
MESDPRFSAVQTPYSHEEMRLRAMRPKHVGLPPIDNSAQLRKNSKIKAVTFPHDVDNEVFVANQADQLGLALRAREGQHGYLQRSKRALVFARAPCKSQHRLDLTGNVRIVEYCEDANCADVPG